LLEFGGPHVAELSPRFPETAGPHPRPATGPGLSPHRVADALVRVVRGLTRRYPLLVGIDDLHAADPDSVTTLLPRCARSSSSFAPSRSAEGGTLTLTSGPDAGTRIVASVPVIAAPR
jgi:hypothetical protein